jgi:hypothetical protein
MCVLSASYVRALCVPVLPLPAATVTPVPCGNATVYCPQGSALPRVVQPGYYSSTEDGGAGNVSSTANDTLMSRQIECPVGVFCTGGVTWGCPAGKFQSQLRKSSLSDCQACWPGYFCGMCQRSEFAVDFVVHVCCALAPMGLGVGGCDRELFVFLMQSFVFRVLLPLRTTMFAGASCGAPQPCGSDRLYCPAQSEMPLVAGAGYYTEGVPGTRSSRTICPMGQFCVGDGGCIAPACVCCDPRYLSHLHG